MYRRFLNRDDYLAIITDTALDQLVRNNNNRFIQAEQAAEASIIDYLSENYEVENELNKGKYIFDYDPKITYPVGVHFYQEGKIYETIQAIRGYKKPSIVDYWKEVTEYLEDTTQITKYSQMVNYHPDDIVSHNNQYYRCISANGYDFNDVRIPGVNAWEKKEAPDWDSIPYELWDVVRYNDQFFTLMTAEGFDQMLNPMESECWGLIGEYDPLYTYELSEHEYVVYGKKVFFPTINPNPDTPHVGVNITEHDPRNYNLKRHMVQLALYELHKLISPVNISNVRIEDYEHSMQWLKDASRLKLNPQIPRKLDATNKKPLTDWQMATFQADYNPNHNIWLI